MGKERKLKILIADDSEMNRSILIDMLGDEFDFIEAENGKEALSILKKRSAEIDLLLLDIMMPEMDGLDVLRQMNASHEIVSTPVIVISAETDPDKIKEVYDLGVTDFIGRPFDEAIVWHRVTNTIMLFSKQKTLENKVIEQVVEKEKLSKMMINILGHIVEFRNQESGQHVLHIRTLTELILRHLSEKTKKKRAAGVRSGQSGNLSSPEGTGGLLFDLSEEEIAVISTAAAIHDIGKIGIPGEILNKPGRLTDEEFTVIKSHTEIGAAMLDALPAYQDEPLVRRAYEICRWHHERYDGRGYPDGLKGDEIPISAQIVALADVYDALTSERVYKKAIPHETAVQMILDGQCGQFNPELLECLREIEGTICEEMRRSEEREAALGKNGDDTVNLSREVLERKGLMISDRTLGLLEHERMKYRFFADMSEEVQFEFTLSPPSLMLSEWGAAYLGLDEVIMNPLQDPKVLKLANRKDIERLSAALRGTTPEDPIVKMDYCIRQNGGERWMKIIGRAIWAGSDSAEYQGAIGKMIDVHETRVKMAELEEMASHDPMTGLYNHRAAKIRIQNMIAERPDCRFALAIFDLDHFKQANDTYGHQFGDQVLIHMAQRLQRVVRAGTVTSRVGGDEFLLFLEYKEHVDLAINRIFNALMNGDYEQFHISVSLGVAKTDTVGKDYDTLFHAADQALYSVKRAGGGQFRFYDSSSSETLSAISPIDGCEENTGENGEKGE